MFIRVSRQGPGAALLQQPHLYQILSRNQFAFTAWANTRVVTHYAEQGIMLFQETLSAVVTTAQTDTISFAYLTMGRHLRNECVCYELWISIYGDARDLMRNDVVLAQSYIDDVSTVCNTGICVWLTMSRTCVTMGVSRQGQGGSNDPPWNLKMMTLCCFHMKWP